MTQQSELTCTVLADFFRCPEEFAHLRYPSGQDLSAPGYFRYGPDAILYGPAVGKIAPDPRHSLPDLSAAPSPGLDVPFAPRTIIDNLRLERYPIAKSPLLSKPLSAMYYQVRPYLGNWLRKTLQKIYFRKWSRLEFPRWPVETAVDDLHQELLRTAMESQGVERVPFIWFWPDGAPAAATMTHDVEDEAGLRLIPQLIELDRSMGIQASYQVVPEGAYEVTPSLLALIRAAGCEVNVHDVEHRGNLFRSREEFLRQADKIQSHAKLMGARGFRAGCMYRNAEWLGELGVSYDMSIPNVAHLEPQRGGCCTVFPYFIGDVLEIPLTTIQDYGSFRILQEYSTNIWDRQIDRILSRNGLISTIAHPDYVFEEKALIVYKRLLGRLVQLKQEMGVWLAKPGQIDSWWRQRSQMRLVAENSGYRVEGEGAHRARVAMAEVRNGRLKYLLADSGDSGEASVCLKQVGEWK